MTDSTFAKETDMMDHMEQGRFAFNTFYSDEQLRTMLNNSMADKFKSSEMMDHMDHGRPDSNATYTDDQLRNALTNTMTIPPELFEKLYLQPKTAVKGDLRKKFANPTPLAIMGFAVALFPLSIELSKAESPIYYSIIASL